MTCENPLLWSDCWDYYLIQLLKYESYFWFRPCRVRVIPRSHWISFFFIYFRSAHHPKSMAPTNRAKNMIPTIHGLSISSHPIPHVARDRIIWCHTPLVLWEHKSYYAHGWMSLQVRDQCFLMSWHKRHPVTTGRPTILQSRTDKGF